MNVKVFAVSAVFFFKGAELTVDFGVADFKVFLPFCLNAGACFGIFCLCVFFGGCFKLRNLRLRKFRRTLIL